MLFSRRITIHKNILLKFNYALKNVRGTVTVTKPQKVFSIIDKNLIFYNIQYAHQSFKLEVYIDDKKILVDPGMTILQVTF